MWTVRSNRNIKKIFAQFWKTQDLLVSFDGCGLFRDWNINPLWKTRSGWYHVDQNPVKKPDQCCIQGFLSLTEQNVKSGGLIVYPKTHQRFAELRPITQVDRDFLPVPTDHALMDHGNAVGRLVQCSPGDFILWDSRLIHCNAPAGLPQPPVENAPPSLLRMVAYISMSPNTMVHCMALDQFRKKRKQMVEKNATLSHWSTELYETSSCMIDRRNKQLWFVFLFVFVEPNQTLPTISMRKLNAYQRGLVIGLHVEDEDQEEVAVAET
jgi:hypothetical protein